MNTSTTKEKEARSLLQKIGDLFTQETTTREHLTSVLEDAMANDVIDDEAKRIIEGALDVTDMHARDIIIPRTQMVYFHVDQPLREIVDKIIETKHSRYPVVGEQIDDVLGILLAKDLLPFIFHHDASEFQLSDLLRPATVVPESKRLNALLKEFREERNHMALVIDEYGSVAGLVTIEDVLEEIVGEIEDEYDDEDDQFIRKVSDNNFIIKALTPIDDFNDFFESKLEEEEFDTIGGLISSKFGRLPKQHEEVEINGFMFRVLSADSRRVHLLRMKFSGV